MRSFVKHCCSVIIISILLTGCLPGKKQEEKVIAQAQQATQQVAAERVAADMSNAAQTLMASSNLNPSAMPSLVSADLQTVKCTDGKSVVAFIPRSSKMTKGGTLDKAMANRIRNQLQAQFTVKAVGSSEMVSDCIGTEESVAINAPVLRLDNVSANLSEQKDDSNVTSVNVASCPEVDGKHVPGVIVTKTLKDQTVRTENHCGQAMDAQVKVDDTMQLSSNAMPDWKKQLAGIANAQVSFKCVVRAGSGKCVDAANNNAGDKTQCDDASVKDEYLSNPVFSGTTFTSGTGDVDCGKGWTGQLVARVSSKQCKIKVNGQEMQPAMIYDVAYVAAKCSRQNIVTQCPANPGKFYTTASMDEPVLLQPQASIQGVAQPSLIALPGYVPDQETASNVMRLTNSTGVFTPSVNLRTSNDPDLFSSKLVKDMASHVKMKCNIVGNQCSGDNGIINHVVVIMDRSSSMGSKETRDKVIVPDALAQGYSCKAGLSNIFTIDQSKAACSAAKKFVQQVPAIGASSNGIEPRLMDFVIHPWSNANPPSDDATISLYKTMENALVDKAKYIPYLQFSLATGWDCSGRTKAGSNDKESFPDDMYGTCSGTQGNSCDSNCPGECQQTAIAPKPDLVGTQRIQAAELLLKNFARMHLNPNTKVTLASFINDNASDIKTEVYCPTSRQDANGNCDMSLERQALINMFTRPGDIKEFVKPVSQDVFIPTEAPALPKIYIVPYDRQWTSPRTEYSSDIVVSPNYVLTGRQHGGDEHGNTIYQYAKLHAVDEKGNAVPGVVTIEDTRLSEGIIESAFGVNYHAPAGRVITGRHHAYDQDGETWYETSVVKFNGVPTTVTDSAVSLRIMESDKTSDSHCKNRGSDSYPCTGTTGGFNYQTPTDSVLVGRTHEGDENRDTWYVAGRISVDCSASEGSCPKICDVSDCSRLPAVTNSSDWEGWDTAHALGKENNGGDYEYRNCSTVTADPSNCPDDPGNPAPMSKNDSGFSLFGKAYAKIEIPECQLAPKPTNAWITDDEPTGYTYCTQRRLRQDWITAASAKAGDLFDESVLPAPTYQNNNDYQFQSCSDIEDCTKIQHDCDTSGDSGTCSAAASCKTNLQTELDAVKDQWLTGVTEANCSNGICDKVTSYCSERLKKPSASSDNEALLSCLDGHGCTPRVYAYTDIRTCQTATNLFSGVTATKCSMVKMPASVDYRSTGYTGKYIQASVTHYVPAHEGESGAVQVASGTSVWGADYGGNTPLYATIDAVLKYKDVKDDLDAQKAMGFIVMTDGADTGATATTSGLCDDKNTSMLSQIAALDPNVKSMFISLDDDGPANVECLKKAPQLVINQLSFFATSARIGEFLGINNAGAPSSISGSLDSARQFCINTYGADSVYKDDSVSSVTTGGNANHPAVCRPFEGQ